MPCRKKSVGIDESAGLGVVVAALEVVEPRLGVVDIAAVAQGVQGAYGAGLGAGGGKGIAPGIVGVAGHGAAEGIKQAYDIALQVRHIVVDGGAVGDGEGQTGGIVGEIESIAALGHLHQLAAVIDIFPGGGSAVLGAYPLGAQAIGIVGKGPAFAGTLHGGQLPAMLPGHDPIAVGQGVSDLVVGDGHGAVGGQLILPAGGVVAVGAGGSIAGDSGIGGGVGVLLAPHDIADAVVAPQIGGSAGNILADKAV